ncbi:peptidase C1B, bleomycin hydrolase [Schizopora paradoxa]|uniref:Cysteine proteinase 1, mitochondrial n=1 Tax=Schizopora paradoxa TaxID=27342 RepID=A0A0H2S5R1_9AGAM|nr:peptidase C1B, bleomycin hydrolase [Schizopora paradoxa]
MPTSNPISEDGSITTFNIAGWEGDVSKNDKIKLSRTILVDADFKVALVSRSKRVEDTHVFNHQIKLKTGPITNQKASGRCWLFATTNILRYSIMEKLNLKEFELSQSYVLFWDKLNKANFYLENIIDTADLPLDDRMVDYLSKNLINDSSQWDMAVNIIEARGCTEGIVPQSIYPESFSSSSSRNLNALLRSKLREHALILREYTTSLHQRKPGLEKEDVVVCARAKKETLMKEVWAILTITLGIPPNPDEKFTWDYYDKDDKSQTWTGTPVEYYKTFTSTDYPPSESFSLINDPRNSYKKLYSIDRFGNVWGGRSALYVNTEIDDLKAAVIKMIKAGEPVFFGCDYGQFSDTASGIMDLDLHQFETAFDISFGLTKAQRLQLNESQMTHAMVISGVHLDASEKPVRYKVENSWGPNVGNKGYFVMTDAWFEQFVYQVVVPRSLAPKELVKVYDDGEKIMLPPWDPMGSVAESRAK